jgi:hypothetical protein
MKHINEEDYKENPTLSKILEPENDLKNILIQYVGKRINPEDKNVTVEMVIDVMAAEFPDFLLVVAEENFIRGYQQAIEDVEVGQKLMEEDEERENCKLLEEQEQKTL